VSWISKLIVMRRSSSAVILYGQMARSRGRFPTDMTQIIVRLIVRSETDHGRAAARRFQASPTTATMQFVGRRSGLGYTTIPHGAYVTAAVPEKTEGKGVDNSKPLT